MPMDGKEWGTVARVYKLTLGRLQQAWQICCRVIEWATNDWQRQPRGRLEVARYQRSSSLVARAQKGGDVLNRVQGGWSWQQAFRHAALRYPAIDAGTPGKAHCTVDVHGNHCGGCHPEERWADRDPEDMGAGRVIGGRGGAILWRGAFPPSTTLLAPSTHQFLPLSAFMIGPNLGL